jgi:hypothetical protein
MKGRIIKFMLCLLLGLSLPAGDLFGQDDQLIIVGNAASVPSEMDMNQLKSVLKGEKLRWNDGSRVSLALMKTSTPVGTETCEKLYNMTANELNKYFLALVFQGKVKAPTFFNSTNELEAYVAETPGAIGVMRQPAGKTLKVILVDGKTQI